MSGKEWHRGETRINYVWSEIVTMIQYLSTPAGTWTIKKE